MRQLAQWAALACAALAGASCAGLTHRDVVPPEVYLVDILPEGGGLFEQRVRVELRLQNPNDFDLRVTGLEFELEANGEPLARGLTGERVTIPRLGELVIPVKGSTTSMGLLHQVVLLGELRQLHYALRGRVFLADPDTSVPFQREAQLTPSP